MHDKLAHTAEHAFIGALQKLLNQTLQVRKVEHKDSGNTAFIVISHLDLDIVFQAEAMVNSLIAEGRKVTMRSFQSLREARKAVPALRANEERIVADKEVRVVEIENHDAAACAMEHAGNLEECDFFLVTRVSKSGNEHEVDFVVGRQAKEIAVILSTKLLRVCSELGANVNTIESTARKLKAEGAVNLRKLKALTRDKLGGIEPSAVLNGRLVIYKGVFSNLEGEQLLEYAGEKIKDENTVVLLANIVNAGGDNEEAAASVVLAINEKMGAIDLNRLFKQFAGAEGRGGGKPHFVTGITQKQDAASLVEKVSEAILLALSQPQSEQPDVHG